MSVLGTCPIPSYYFPQSVSVPARRGSFLRRRLTFAGVVVSAHATIRLVVATVRAGSLARGILCTMRNTNQGEERALINELLYYFCYYISIAL